ncbi:uncharacterized protein B0H18DRAFT_1139256 [Fomitopsis serialis]|uniref:uncharacterized protein n=1 Tax=Fomitopsis serialis TaxID=139415 RepID=UPI002008BF75|nr:uncharacterized protein B0H18DRAFT_1139256 [Neoantrodia serialis]KAH9931967.1 hypothetical protein B0H18DRAFT_1139256 [Neoantrodia serialis]
MAYEASQTSSAAASGVGTDVSTASALLPPVSSSVSRSSSFTAGDISGTVVGAVVGLFAILLGAFVLIYRRQRRQGMTVVEIEPSSDSRESYPEGAISTSNAVDTSANTQTRPGPHISGSLVSTPSPYTKSYADSDARLSSTPPFQSSYAAARSDSPVSCPKLGDQPSHFAPDSRLLLVQEQDAGPVPPSYNPEWSKPVDNEVDATPR